MRILIIEDEIQKYEHIKKSLSDLIDGIIIDLAKTRNDGLLAIKNHNYKQNNPYDLVICDNYMPINEGAEIGAYASEIVTMIRDVYSIKDILVVICSSMEVNDCDYDYFVKYDSSDSLDESFKEIINDILKCKHNKCGRIL